MIIERCTAEYLEAWVCLRQAQRSIEDMRCPCLTGQRMPSSILREKKAAMSSLSLSQEPLFMGIDAEVELLPVMNAADLRKGLKSAMDAM